MSQVKLLLLIGNVLLNPGIHQMYLRKKSLRKNQSRSRGIRFRESTMVLVLLFLSCKKLLLVILVLLAVLLLPKQAFRAAAAAAAAAFECKRYHHRGLH